MRKSGKIIIKGEEELIYKEEITKLNISNSDFDIEKAEIEIVVNNNRQILLANLKYRKEGNYLITIRIAGGFEVARFYLTKDTILINDKIRRKIYAASTNWLYEKYGISVTALPVLFGDYISENKYSETARVCTNGIAETNEKILDKDIRYKLDCNNKKVIKAMVGDLSKSESILFAYESFKNIENHKFPCIIEMQDTSKSLIIRINVERVKFTGLDNIYFVPGKNYEEVPLK